jgi:Flp pilus assembly pilin Flp
VVAWVAVVVVAVGTLVATLVASAFDEAGQDQTELVDDEPYVRDDLS